MDAAFCARMHAAIAAGLEFAPTSVRTAPGTKNPKYVSDLTAKYYRPPDARREASCPGLVDKETSWVVPKCLGIAPHVPIAIVVIALTGKHLTFVVLAGRNIILCL
jgi:hypothetical protein